MSQPYSIIYEDKNRKCYRYDTSVPDNYSEEDAKKWVSGRDDIYGVTGVLWEGFTKNLPKEYKSCKKL